MKNFKEFLVEGHSNVYPEFAIGIFWVNDGKIDRNTWSDDLRDDISAKINKLRLGYAVDDIDVTMSNFRKFDFTCSIELKDPKFSNDPDVIDEFADNVMSIIKSLNSQYEIDDMDIDCFIYGIPTIKTHYSRVNLVPRPSMNLSGIEKVLTCDKLIIRDHIEHISKGVLWLLRVPNLRIVYAYPNTSKVETGAPWLKIVNKHLAGDKNFFECQEELFTSGLRRFV